MDVIIPTNLVCVLFGPAIPISYFNFIQLVFKLIIKEQVTWILKPLRIFMTIPHTAEKSMRGGQLLLIYQNKILSMSQVIYTCR